MESMSWGGSPVCGRERERDRFAVVLGKCACECKRRDRKYGEREKMTTKQGCTTGVYEKSETLFSCKKLVFMCKSYEKSETCFFGPNEECLI